MVGEDTCHKFIFEFLIEKKKPTKQMTKPPNQSKEYNNERCKVTPGSLISGLQKLGFRLSLPLSLTSDLMSYL